MTDIVKRLRDYSGPNVWCGPAMLEAADEIERLRGRYEEMTSSALALTERAEKAEDEIERLRKENFALAADQCHDDYGDEVGNHRCREIDRLREGRDTMGNLWAKAKEEIAQLRAENTELMDENGRLALDKFKLTAEIDRLRPYVEAFRREESRADRLDAEIDLLHAHAGCPSDRRMTVGECNDRKTCGCSLTLSLSSKER